MQTYEEYRSSIHTPGQAVDKVRYFCSDFTYRFGLRVLETLINTLLFIIALQSSTLITESIDNPELPFNVGRLSIVMVITAIIILVSYVKEYYVRGHDTDGYAYTKSNGWAHSYHQ